VLSKEKIMKNARNPFLLILVLIILSPIIQAASKSATRITGEIIDEQTNEKLGLANVIVYAAGDTTQVTGTASGKYGYFIIDDLPFGTYDISIYMMGYKKEKIKNIRLDLNNSQINLNQIKLQSKVMEMSEVEVIADRSYMQLELDKKVFTVGKDLAYTGKSAADVLDDIPSVTVDLEGNVSLRGSDNVVILVDGKPSGLVGITGTSALRQLSANLIEKVEIITNPSARYDAEGMAGIIDIILRKDTRWGLNGSLDLTTGYPANHGAAVNLNFRREKFNLFLNYGFRYHSHPGKGNYYQEFYNNDTTTYLEEDREHEHGGWGNNIRLGTDYFFNKKNILTGSFLYSYHDEDNSSEIEYRDFDFQKILTNISQRTDNEGEIEKTLEYTLSYKKLFDRKNHELTADFRYQSTSEHETSDILEQSTSEDPLEQYVSNLEEEERYLFQIDYTDPFGKDGRFETGIKSNFRNVNNDYYVNELDDNNIWTRISDLSNNLDYTENIHAAYAIIGNKFNPFSYQIGIRGEYSDVRTYLQETGEKNNRYYFDIFPSMHLTYEFLKQNSLQISYSRRLRRPRHRHLNPFYGYSDSRNIRRGNPDLDPEFTHSVEFNYIKHWRNASFSSGIYYRHTDGAIGYIRSLQDTIIVSQPENLLTRKSYGLEITSTIDLFKWWNFDGNLNFYRGITDGGNLGPEYKSDSYSWYARLNSKITFWKDIDMQIRFHYRGPRESVQGKRDASYFADIGLSKDVLRGNGTITLNVRDVFDTRKYSGETFGDDFYSTHEFQRHSRMITLGFNYRLNQKRRRGGRDRRQFQNGAEDYGDVDM
jgi:outer membrane cobalamin receptor